MISLHVYGYVYFFYVNENLTFKNIFNSRTTQIKYQIHICNLYFHDVFNLIRMISKLNFIFHIKSTNHDIHFPFCLKK